VFKFKTPLPGSCEGPSANAELMSNSSIFSTAALSCVCFSTAFFSAAVSFSGSSIS